MKLKYLQKLKPGESAIFKALVDLCDFGEPDICKVHDALNRMLSLPREDVGRFPIIFGPELAAVMTGREVEEVRESPRIAVEVWYPNFEKFWGEYSVNTPEKAQLYLATAYMATHPELKYQLKAFLDFVSIQKDQGPIWNNLSQLMSCVAFEASSEKLPVGNRSSQREVIVNLAGLYDHFSYKRATHDMASAIRKGARLGETAKSSNRINIGIPGSPEPA